MIGSYGFISLILSCLISIIHPQISNVTSSAEFSTKLGRCSCSLYGKSTKCTDYEIFCDQLPHECSSYFWTETRVTLYYNIFDAISRKNDDYFKQILHCTKIPVILGYGYDTIKEWSLVLGCCGANETNVQDEVEALKAYRKDHPNIAGLALMNLDSPSNTYIEDLTDDLNCYVNALKESMPDLDIGINIYADFLLLKYKKNPELKWINFEELTDNVNFIVVTYSFLNIDCTPALKNGVHPVTGKHNFTLKKFMKILDAFGVPTKKTSFKFEIGPKAPPKMAKKGFPTLCKVNIRDMCLNPINSSDFCSDTTKTYYEKGAFAKNYGAGFIVMPADKDDIFCDCQCGHPFPSFRAILDGYNGAPCPQPCALLDRN